MRSKPLSRLVVSLSVLLLASPIVRGQFSNVTNSTTTPTAGTGHDYIKMLAETVDIANGAINLRIQVPTPPGRRLVLPFAFAYDSNSAFLQTMPQWPGFMHWSTNQNIFSNGSWSYTLPQLNAGLITYTDTFPQGTIPCHATVGYVFQDPLGGRHPLNLSAILDSLSQGTCVRSNWQQDLTGHDDLFSAWIGNISGNYYKAASGEVRVADADGTVYDFNGSPNSPYAWGTCPGIGATAYSLPSSIEDRNGNVIKISGVCGGTTTITDTAGRTPLSISGFGVTGNTVAIAGLPQPYTLTWGSGTGSTVSLNPKVVSAGSNCPAPGGTWGTWGGQWSGITAITLPNGKQYQLAYDSTYGMVSKITYPTGGYVSYTWGLNPQSAFASYADSNGLPNECNYTYDRPAIIHRYVSFDGTTIALQQDFSYSTTWNPTYDTQWTTKQTTVTTHDLVRGTSFQTVYSYSPIQVTFQPNTPINYSDWQIPVEQTISYKDFSGAVLRTVSKGWADQYEMYCEVQTLDNGMISGTFYGYGRGLTITDKREYGFGLLTAGSCPGGNPSVTPTRETATIYQAFPNTPIFQSGFSLFDKPCQTITYNGTGNRVAETDFFYDGSTSTTPCSTATTQTLPGTGSYTSHDETLYGTAASVPRGNLTKAVRQCFQGAQSCANNLTTTSTYDETGQITSTTDPNNNISHYSYADSYTVLSGGVNTTYTPSGNTNAFLTKITDPLTHTQNFIYDFNNGQLTIATDQNSLTTTYLYNDSLARPTSSTRPDNGQTTIAYNDTALIFTTSKKINPSQTVTTVALSDGLGHVKQSQLTSDPQGTVYIDTSYDGLGRVYTVSNPYRTGSDPTTSSGTTTHFYDSLGRKCLEVPPDGTLPTGGLCPSTQPANDLLTTYSGNTTTVTDQTNKSRKSVLDGLGRLMQVFEDPAGLNYETDYTYDALGNLLTVNQKGGSTNSANWRTRTFTYDSLSRLLTSNNPEVGTITYKYDSDTNCTGSSFLGLLVSKLDGRGIRTCAQYDAINRETTLTYSNGDPSVTTTYDQAVCLGLAACQNIGYRTSMSDAAGSEVWSYQVDAVNNRSAHAERRTTNSSPSNITKTSTYYFDQAGNVFQAVYPTGRVVNYAFDSANRPSTAIDGSNGITYANDFQTAPSGCLTGKVCYTPQGSFYALSIGQTSSFSGLNLTHSYNSRLQPLEFKASSTGGNAIDISYNFVDPVSGKNAGHVYGITNNLDTTRSQNFTYDQLNRITSALTTSTHATSPTHCWGETYNVDAWGNLQSIAATTNSNYTSCLEESGFSATADGNNHLNTFSYDASGNAQNDGVNSYTWNAESQLKSGGGVNYLYDGDGRRVAKAGSKLYWYGSGGDILAETDACGNTTAEYIFFGGKRISMIPWSGASCSSTVVGNPIYYVEDLLGTSRVTTTNTGVVCYDADFYPYGGERPYANTCAQNYKFEGKERDGETGNDDFGARYYSNRFGRWLSADWSSVPAPVPYVNLTNPQTLNLYAMVAADPESFADLDGHNGAGVTTLSWQSYLNGLTVMQVEECDAVCLWQYNAENQQQQNQASAQQQAGPTMGIGIEVPASSAVQNNVFNVASDPGHVFIYLKDASGNIVSMLSFGPGEPIGALNKGDVTSGNLPGNAKWQLGGSANTWVISITPQQLSTGKDAISAFKANVPNYTPSTQCTSAALSIAAKMGVSLPNGVGPVIARKYDHTFYSGNVSNPYHLNKQMTARFGPGTVVNTRIFPTP